MNKQIYNYIKYIFIDKKKKIHFKYYNSKKLNFKLNKKNNELNKSIVYIINISQISFYLLLKLSLLKFDKNFLLFMNIKGKIIILNIIPMWPGSYISGNFIELLKIFISKYFFICKNYKKIKYIIFYKK